MVDEGWANHPGAGGYAEEIDPRLEAGWGWIWRPPPRVEGEDPRALRIRLLRGLVRIGGTEPVPAGVGPRKSLALTEDDRLRMLAQTLAELRAPLEALGRVVPEELGRLGDGDAQATASEAIRLAFRLTSGYLGAATQAHENLGTTPVRSDLERERVVILESLGLAAGALGLMESGLGDHAPGLREQVRGDRATVEEILAAIDRAFTLPEELTREGLAARLADARAPIRTVVELRRKFNGRADVSPGDEVRFEGPAEMLVEAFRMHAAGAIEEVAGRLEEVVRHLRGSGAGDGAAAAGAAGARRAEEARRLLTRDPVMLKALINVWGPVRKVFVAVHGIGDQFRNATVQSVAYAVCRYVGQPTAIPLGRFQGPGGTLTKAYIPDPASDPPINCGFAEIYWADVPREPVDDAHILEAPTSWARALVEKLRLRAEAAGADGDGDRDRDAQLEALLQELIVGVNVANRLLRFAERAGVFRFDLARLLDDYLNDVQVVTEFEDYRRQLLEIFDDVLSKLHKYMPTAQVYLVAHSEGTVVAFLGLLRGLHQKRAWTSRVRGLMTIGSPLNKHVEFWPELFEAYAPPKEPPPGFRPIRWKNYYDYGDPVGYNLAPTRLWMRTTGSPRRWSEFFAVAKGEADEVIDEALRGAPRSALRQALTKQAGETKGDDYGFTRYYFPGKAHNDYWEDPDVFGNFLKTVVDPGDRVLALPDDPGRRREHEGRRERYRERRPDSNGFAMVVSWMLPYVLACALLFVACYLLYSPARWALDPDGARVEGAGRTLGNLAGISCLVAGMSLLGRIPRISRGWGWVSLAFVLAGVFGVGYVGLTDAVIREPLARFLTTGDARSSRLVNPSQDGRWRSVPAPGVTQAGILIALALAALAVHRVLYVRGMRGGWLKARIGAGVFELAMIGLLLLGPGTHGFTRPDLDVLLCVSVLTAAFLIVTADIRALKPVGWMVIVVAGAVELARLIGPVGPAAEPGGDARWARGGAWWADTPSWGLVFVALTLGAASWLVSRRYPDSGTRPLIHTVGLVLVLILATAFLVAPPPEETAAWRSRVAAIAARADGALDDADRVAIARAAEAENRRAFQAIARLTRRGESGAAGEDPRGVVERSAAMQQVVESSLDRGPIWPVLLGLPAFLYLWWLVVILFDLTFVWHLYIRYNGAQEYLLRQTLARLRPREGSAGA